MKLHGSRNFFFAIPVKMRVNVGSRGNIGVAEPLLNVLHLESFGYQQTRAAVPQIMEPDLRHPRFFQQQLEMPRHEIRRIQLAVIPFEDVIVLDIQIYELFAVCRFCCFERSEQILQRRRTIPRNRS